MITVRCRPGKYERSKGETPDLAEKRRPGPDARRKQSRKRAEGSPKTPKNAALSPKMGSIDVYARVRPLLQRELHEQAPRVVQTTDGVVAVQVETDGTLRERRFRFQRVFGETTSQQQVFTECALPLVDAVMNGASACCLSYGQTGTGKTHTMLGESLDGLIPRCMGALFERISTARVSYVEIHNERVADLLSDRQSLDIRDDCGVVGAEVVDVSSLDEVLDVLRLGAERRAIAATDLNERSSRSHTIFSVEVNGASLRLADLAGSEKWRTEELRDYSKHRIKELTSINQSLSALANVVSALKDGRPHVPYRASKLTRLLRDAFAGGRCAFVATLSPSALCADETISTLHFARRAMRVRTFACEVAPETTSNNNPRRVRELEAALQGARAEIARLRRGSAAADAPEDASEVADARALCERRRALVDEWDTAADAEAREAWLHDYHAWLRALPPLLPEDLAGASVELRERVRLMEAAVLVQAEVLQARTTTKPLAASNVASPRWRTTGSAKADLLRSVGADPGAVDELAAAAARARARANYEIM
jgi:hypothetical protein